ncbi:hypothetical protein [Microlunatus sp. GCM10028923]|uniref:sulfotransferase-like domain-containing protein n=1 Tax=Microlunatus sp. GCM10028923 TaxID=3273400 RepID=UPI00361DEE54
MSGRIIALWSTPRSRSTAFFRSMLERGDLLVLHEPFCNLKDHGLTEVLGRTVRTVNDLKDLIVELAEGQDVFFKDTTDRSHSPVLDDLEFSARITHSFLVRRPDEIAASFHAIKPDLHCEEVGVENLWNTYTRASDLSVQPPPVIDAADLVADPEQMMILYCRAVGIHFRPESLTWKAGHRTEWRLTKEWHESIAGTTHFSNRATEYAATAANTPRLAEISAHHAPFYERLRAAKLTPPSIPPQDR